MNDADPAAAALPPIAPEHVLKLAGIIALIVVGVFVLFLQHVLGSLRRRSSDKLLHAIVLGAYTLSYSLVSYTLGLMQNSEYYFKEFPVWAVCLLMLLGGTDSLTACILNDVDNWKGFYVKHLLKGVLVVYIVAKYGPKSGYQAPLWGILAVNVLQSYARITSMRMASKSHLLWKIVKPIDDHMKDEVLKPSSSAEKRDPKTMQGYRFIVAGKPRQEKDAKKIDRVSHDDIRKARDTAITTVEDVWGCNGRLLSSDSERGMRFKDVCLSMALSKMLNRRFAGFDLPKAELDITSEFVFQGLLAGDKRAERAFRVIEAELGFVHDLYYTRYPYLYHKSRYFALYLPIAMVILCSWLTYKISRKLKKQTDDNIPLETTLYLMAVVTFLEAFQLYLHISSGWLKVALIRSYVARHAQQRRSHIFSAIAGVLLRLKAFRPWEAKLGQYSLLRYFDCTRRTSTFVHYVTLCLVDKARKGRERGKLVKLSDQVKQAVVDCLVRTKGKLTNGVTSLEGNDVRQLLWACDAKDKMVTHTILVWHIATTLCKHQLEAQAKGKHQLDAQAEDKQLVDTASKVASDLSQYCAYLTAFAPNLLPDGSFASFLLSRSIEEALELEWLKGAKTMEIKCTRLMSKIDAHEASRVDHDSPVILLGARLATQLMKLDLTPRWKVLSDFWAEMVLYVAPCDDAQAREHLVALARGGEFITHLWALLTHAGVLEQSPPLTQPSA